MEVVNAIVQYYGIFKEVMLFIRPAVIILLVLASAFEVLVLYVQHKYKIFSKKLSDKLEYYNVYNLTDETRYQETFKGRLFLIPFILYLMCSPTFINGILQAFFVFVGLVDILRILYFTYQVFSPYWKQART